MEAFLPERKLLRLGKLSKAQVPEALSLDYWAVKTCLGERVWWSYLEIGQGAPGMQLLSVVIHAGVGFLVIKLSLGHSWSSINLLFLQIGFIRTISLVCH